MPSTYAHCQLGKEIISRLNPQEREIIKENLHLYQAGLHGPDILFYYDALHPNGVNKIGNLLHQESGRKFFSRCSEKLDESFHKDASLAYIYGLLAHFALDVSCHGYVHELTAATDLQHTEIEGEFDRYLMLKDGLNPVTHSLTRHIHPSTFNARVIAPFYPGVSEEEILRSLIDMVKENRILLCKNPAKRKFLYLLMHIGGVYPQLHGMIINPDGNPACEKSNETLMELYQTGCSRAVSFISQFLSWKEGESEADPIFDYNFDGALTEDADSERPDEGSEAYAGSEGSEGAVDTE
ncbi:MAG: zinc dependent phospholipase C family protein [Eubacterium sp.]|jgi:hypothetical protein|nr:zinc dependent phospholipase C family protein [Eubacterium sp.]MCH4045966.1 zinc dependent phospholipase C family protein [Eubacterium sp.]MCH4079060.1 zinc dependent phospholipase C family protein [Eubacterium sp.]MCH4111217.1 zinc dependent phospholipase C family protein [Eubacterium sp.]MCI1306955.1 zinc dependent phospholipase C family protein [Eubacterium sp.]